MIKNNFFKNTGTIVVMLACISCSFKNTKMENTGGKWNSLFDGKTLKPAPYKTGLLKMVRWFAWGRLQMHMEEIL